MVSQSITFSAIIRLLPRTARRVLSCADITYFISVSVALGRRFNAASKKENNTEGMSIHFLIRSFPIPVEPYNIDENNQALKLLLVTAIVNSVPYLDH